MLKRGENGGSKTWKSVMKLCIAEIGGWKAEMTAGASSREKEELSAQENLGV